MSERQNMSSAVQHDAPMNSTRLTGPELSPGCVYSFDDIEIQLWHNLYWSWRAVAMLSAFTARPIVELRQKDKFKIESILAYGTFTPVAYDESW